MPTISKISKLLALGAAAAALSGCASFLTGPYEKIAVSSSPENALCKIYREGQGYLKAVATPDETYVMRHSAPLTVTCSKKGYQTTSVVVAVEEQTNDIIANASSLGAGIFVDVANSAHLHLPDNIHVNLPRE